MPSLRFLFLSSFLSIVVAFLNVPQVHAATLIKNVSFQDLNHVVIQFDQPVLANTAQDKNNYSVIDLNQKHPIINDTLTLQEATYNIAENTVTLWITGTMVQLGESYQLHMENLKNNQGNIIETSDYTFEQGNTSEPAFIDISFSKSHLTLPQDEFALVTVIAKDKQNLPRANIAIGFEIISGKGDLSKVGREVTGDDGKVLATYIPEQEAATHTIRAFVKNNPSIFSIAYLETQITKNNIFPTYSGSLTDTQAASQTNTLENTLEINNSENTQTIDQEKTPPQGKVLAANDSLPQSGIEILFYIIPALFIAFLVERQTRKSIQ